MKKKFHRRVVPNWELRMEMIKKGLIVPRHMVPDWLRSRGFEEAANAAAGRRHGYDY